MALVATTASAAGIKTRSQTAAMVTKLPKDVHKERKRKPLSERDYNIVDETDQANTKRVKTHSKSVSEADLKKSTTRKKQDKSAGPQRRRVRKCNAVHPQLEVHQSCKVAFTHPLTWDFSSIRNAIEQVETIPDGITRVDEQEENMFYCPQYACDMISYLMAKEKQWCESNATHASAILSQNVRSVLVDWLIQVQNHLVLQQETLHLCVSIVDRFTNLREIPLAKLQLLGVSAILIAAKFVERFPPEVKTLIHLTDNTYDFAEVLQMELTILKILAFYVSLPTATAFVDRFLRVAIVGMQDEAIQKMKYLVYYLMDLHLPDKRVAHLEPSRRAAAAIVLSRMVLRSEGLIASDVDIWTKDLEYYTSYKYDELTRPAKRMAKLLLRSKTSKYKGAYLKYLNRRFDGISDWNAINISTGTSHALLDLLENEKV